MYEIAYKEEEIWQEHAGGLDSFEEEGGTVRQEKHDRDIGG